MWFPVNRNKDGSTALFFRPQNMLGVISPDANTTLKRKSAVNIPIGTNSE
jgi:hypothetical protein